MRRLALLATLALSACSGHEAAGPLPDPVYDTAMDAGRSAFSLSRYDQASEQFNTAYTRALARNDRQALTDAAYNRAASAMRRNRVREALGMLDRARDDLAVRGQTEPAALVLARAAALLRCHEPAQARDIAATLLSNPDPDLAERAAYLNGVARAGLADGAGVAASAGRIVLSPKAPLLWQADRVELDARAALLAGDAARARSLAAKAVGLRQGLLDYRGMRDALGVQARAARALGDVSNAAALERAQAQSAVADGG